MKIKYTQTGPVESKPRFAVTLGTDGGPISSTTDESRASEFTEEQVNACRNFFAYREYALEVVQ